MTALVTSMPMPGWIWRDDFDYIPKVSDRAWAFLLYSRSAEQVSQVARQRLHGAEGTKGVGIDTVQA